MTKRYELDFRERAGRMGYKVQTSVKNFQMTLEVCVSFPVGYLKNTSLSHQNEKSGSLH